MKQSVGEGMRKTNLAHGSLVERLENRCLFSALSSTTIASPPAGTTATQIATLRHVGVVQQVNFIPHPEVALYAPVQEVNVSSESLGGSAPTGSVTFYLDGRLEAVREPHIVGGIGRSRARRVLPQ